jgi:hypothetical protein
MEVPRHEEAVFRTAKSMIRQQEIANTKTKIESKKSEEEMKTLTFWKNKAKVLEENNQKLQSEIQNLLNQNNQILNRYTQLLSTTGGGNNNDNETPGNHRSSLSPGKKNAHSSSNPFLRPASAPQRKPANSSALKRNSSSSGNGIAAESSEAEKEALYKLAMENRMGNMNADEIMKLKAENQHKQHKILALSHKLSKARAYPLLSIQLDEDNEDEYDFENPNKRSTTYFYDDTNFRGSGGGGGGVGGGHHTAPIITSKHAISSNLLSENNFYNPHSEDNKYMKDELESTSSTFLRTEEKLHKKRMEKAVRLQEEFNEKGKSKKSGFPAHVKAIRKSKDFSKYLDDLDLVKMT